MQIFVGQICTRWIFETRLAGADVSGANLSTADLRGANFTGAVLVGTQL
ncbi:MAG TPA: hypothetical protein DIU35_15985 [Candidatus Latescibacteria bacterium]|nr:hypothetical protein [Gemmatimonadota bacterium]HCR18981.1 hypothetical protein [Candidatus Latescibacterota bacterium]